jgi:hypothetical protein
MEIPSNTVIVIYNTVVLVCGFVNVWYGRKLAKINADLIKLLEKTTDGLQRSASKLQQARTYCEAMEERAAQAQTQATFWLAEYVKLLARKS